MPKNVEVLKDLPAYVETAGMAAREQSVVAVVKLLLEASKVDERHRRQLLDIALWKYTEASGLNPHPKYNLRYVTDGARNVDAPASVNHEHVWPRKWMLDRLFARKQWALDDLSDFLGRHAVACIVTVEEHGWLGGVTGTGWGRYAAAGVSVWDRLEGAHLDLTTDTPTTSKRLVAEPKPAPMHELDLHDLIGEKAGARAEQLIRLVRMARFANAVSVVSVTRAGDPSRYFRIHDALLPEPARAVAYPHWTGRVDFALQPREVPDSLMGEDSVKALDKKTYAVSCKVTDDLSLEIAEELLFLALQKVRDANSAVDVG